LVKLIARDFVGFCSNPAIEHSGVQWLAQGFRGFVDRLRRAGLLFLIGVSCLFAVSAFIHPIALFLWIIAIPLVGFGAALSMLWPTRRRSRPRSAAPDFGRVASDISRQLNRSRHEMPQGALPAFDLVLQRLKSLSAMTGNDDNDLVVGDAKRLIGQHLPRLISSYVALPSCDRTNARSIELAKGLSLIADELAGLEETLRSARADRFETERRFIAARFDRTGLAAL
jgi:hypothetical protein